jgi:hypothetical protein
MTAGHGALRTVRRTMLSRALFAALALLLAGAATASPCVQPGDFVKAAPAGAQARQPLQKPYLVGGLAVLALRQHAAQPWLELAVDSPESARRALGAQADKAQVQALDGAVLVSCLGLQEPVAGRKPNAVAVLW